MIARRITLLALALSALPSAALAQSSILVSGADIRVNPQLPESHGVKVGEGRLHPFIELDAHQVYNPGRFSPEAFDAGVPSKYRNDFYFVIRPGVDFKLPSPKLDINANAYVERQDYVNARDFSSWQGGLGGNLHWNKEGPLQLRVSQMLSRTAQPGNQTFTLRFNHWTNSTGLGVDLIPGGGALKISADMNIFVDSYDHQQPGSTQQFPAALLNNQRYTPTVRAAWDFLPKTSIFLEGTTTFTNFDTSSTTNGVNGDSWIYSGFAGLNGQVTPKISAMAKVGYTGITAKPGEGSSITANLHSNTVGAQVEGTWDPRVTTKLRIGGLRSFEPVSIFMYSTMWKAYARLDQAITTRFNLALGAEYYHLSYANQSTNLALGVVNADDRRDDAVDANVALSWFLSEFVTISLLDRIDVRSSNSQYQQRINGTLSANPLPINYVTNDVFLRFSFRY